MDYQLGTFYKNVNSNGMFSYSIEQTYLFYSFHESLLSIIKGSRDYNIANAIMMIILENFILGENKAGFIDKKICKNLDIIHDKALDISYELVRCIHKYYNKDIREFNDIYSKLDLYNKLKKCKIFISDILQSPKIPNISNYKNISSYYYDYNSIKDAIKLFNNLILLYNTIYENKNNLNIQHVNTNDIFISEFFMFFSHFMFAYTVDDIHAGSVQSNAVNFVLNNINRAVNHLERGILDIAKILVVSVISSGYVITDKFIDIIKIRQNEYYSLSQSITERINTYISWLKNIPQFQTNTAIKNMLNEII